MKNFINAVDNKVLQSKLNIFSCLMFLFEGISFAINVVFFPKHMLLESPNKLLLSSVMGLIPILCVFSGSLNFTFLHNTHALKTINMLLISKKCLMIVCALFLHQHELAILLLFIISSLQTISSKLWIEVIKINHKNVHTQIATMHCFSYISSATLLYLAKERILISSKFSLILLIVVSLFGQMLSFLPTLKSYKITSSRFTHSIKKTAIVQDSLYQKKQLFYIIFIIGGFCVTLSNPAINALLANTSNTLETFFLFKQVGQAATFLIFSVFSIEKTYNIFLSMLFYIPIYICMLNINVLPYKLFAISSALMGGSTTLSQLTWSSSSIIFSKYARTSLHITSFNNLILLCRGITGIVLGYLISSLMGVPHLMGMCAIIMLLNTLFSWKYLKKI